MKNAQSCKWCDGRGCRHCNCRLCDCGVCSCCNGKCRCGSARHSQRDPHARVKLLVLAVILATFAGCQPPSTSPDAQSPADQPIRLVSAEGTGSAVLEIAGQQISVSIATETREGADPCVRALAQWGVIQVPWSSGCETEAQPEKPSEDAH